MPDLNFIASLFNVCCRSEVKMAQNNSDFTAQEGRAVMKYLFLKENSTKKIHDMSVTLDGICISRQTEAAAGLQMSRQAFKRNLVPSKQFHSSQGGHYTPETGKFSL
jgi:hypothetical protein